MPELLQAFAVDDTDSHSPSLVTRGSAIKTQSRRHHLSFGTVWFQLFLNIDVRITAGRVVVACCVVVIVSLCLLVIHLRDIIFTTHVSSGTFIMGNQALGKSDGSCMGVYLVFEVGFMVL